MMNCVVATRGGLASHYPTIEEGLNMLRRQALKNIAMAPCAIVGGAQTNEAQELCDLLAWARQQRLTVFVFADGDAYVRDFQADDVVEINGPSLLECLRKAKRTFDG
jgi:hypothetical protein